MSGTHQFNPTTAGLSGVPRPRSVGFAAPPARFSGTAAVPYSGAPIVPLHVQRPVGGCSWMSGIDNQGGTPKA